MMKKAKQDYKTPKEIVAEMDKYIVGQDDAKKAVAIAFVNRCRRLLVKDEKLKAEILPRNVLLYGPTGVGKTEIARRVADITNSPFIKVEMTKFTEVGYAGKDVETIIRDLVAITLKREKDRVSKEGEAIAKDHALSQVLKALNEQGFPEATKAKVANGEYDTKEIKIDLPLVSKKSSGIGEFEGGIGDQLGGLGGGIASISIIPLFDFAGGDKKEGEIEGLDKKKKSVKVRDALETIVEAETAKYVDKNLIVGDVLKKIEQRGVVFLDEIDKLISNKNSQSRGEVSREGVQRDLLPIIEGTMIQTKYGSIRTDHILFIAAGAFQENKPSDLMPELQGRFPVCVKLKSLTVKDFCKILTELKYNLIDQQVQLLKVDGINVDFTNDGIKQIAELAKDMNSELEDTGARRLSSVIEKVVEDISYSNKTGSKAKIDKVYVVKMTKDVFENKVNVGKYVI